VWRLREVGLQQAAGVGFRDSDCVGAGFGGVSRWFSSHEGEPGGFLFRIHRFETDMAADAYRTRGSAGLAAYGKKLERQMGGKRYFTDASGKDLLTGEVRPEAAGEVGAQIRHPFTPNAEITLVGESSEGTLRMISRIPPRLPMSTFLPYLRIVVLAIALLCWPLAANLARPLHTLSQSVDRFGQGDLAVRMGSARPDEIGDLARSFDRMAGRIATLLTAERRLLRDVSHELRSPLARLSFAAGTGAHEWRPGHRGSPDPARGRSAFVAGRNSAGDDAGGGRSGVVGAPAGIAARFGAGDCRRLRRRGRGSAFQSSAS
jgi:HAMP domain-containing protein